MSRTYKTTPYRIQALQDPNRKTIHRCGTHPDSSWYKIIEQGCDLDPNHNDGNYCRYVVNEPGPLLVKRFENPKRQREIEEQMQGARRRAYREENQEFVKEYNTYGKVLSDEKYGNNFERSEWEVW